MSGSLDVSFHGEREVRSMYANRRLKYPHLSPSIQHVPYPDHQAPNDFEFRVQIREPSSRRAVASANPTSTSIPHSTDANYPFAIIVTLLLRHLPIILLLSYRALRGRHETCGLTRRLRSLRCSEACSDQCSAKWRCQMRSW